MNLTGFKFFTVLVLSVVVSDCAWNQHEDIRTGLQVMYGTSNTLLPNIPFIASQTPISFLITYVPALVNPARSAGVGIVGYTASISRDFSPNVTIQNFTSTTLRLTLRVYGDTSITYFSVNWIAVGNSAHFVQVLFNCYLPINLNSGRGYRTDSFTGTTLFIGYSSLSVNVYLAGFTLNNGQGLTNYLSASANIPNGTNTIYYLFATNQNNTVTEICYTTIIFCKRVTIVQQYYDWGLQGNVTLSNQAAQNPSLFPTNNPPDYTDRNRMFFGMSQFSISRGFNRIFNLNTQSYNDLTQNYNTNVGTYVVIMDYFFLAVRGCNNSYNPVNNVRNHPDFDWFNILTLNCQKRRECVNNLSNSGDNDTVVYPTQPGDYCAPCNYTCQTCNGARYDDCTACNSNFFRYPSGTTCPCSVSHIDIGYALCYPCQNFIAGCYTCTTTFFCTSCYPGFVLQPSGFCQCSSGFLITGVCTNITGCTNILSYSGTLYCTACNSTLHFQVNSLYTCSCMTGYYISNNQICLSSCGDGRQVTEQGCDDGNNDGGDGCSSTCFVQTNWTCAGGSPTSASYCRISNIFQLIITYVRRITSMNRMQVGIKIQPSYNQFTLISFKQYITTNVPCTDFNATLINGELVLDFDYNRTIEGQFFNLTLTLDPTIFANDTVLNITIPTSGMNAKLTYDYNNNANYPMQIIVIVLDVLAIIVMFISCISQRMIGIQMIQTLQTVLYTQAVMKTTPSSLSPLQMLRYASGYNQIHGTDYSRTYTFAFSLSSLGLQKQFLLSYNLMYIILMIVIVICIILKLKLTYHQRNVGKYTHQQEQTKNNKKIQITTKVYNFIFERILFLIAFMCMFLIIFALMLQLTDMSSEYTLMSKQLNLLGAGVAAAIICTLLCGVILNGCFPGTLIFPMLMKQYYPPIYFVYQSTFIFVLAFVYTQEYVLYILAGMSFIFMVYNMVHRPYSEKFHTFVLIFHQIIIIAVISVYIFENLTEPTENQTLYKILNGIIIALLYVVVGLNAYRLYKYYLFIKNRGWDQYGNHQNQYDYDKNYQQSPKYKQLKTPKDLNNTRIQQNYMSNNQTQIKKTKLKEQIQLQPIKKANKTNTKAKDLQDQSQMDWKYNKLADQQNNYPRYQATKREILPNTSRDTGQDYNKKRTNQQNPRNKDDNYDDNYTVKQNIKKSPNKSKQMDQTFNQNSYDPSQFDNPYDENGYAKKTSKNIEDDDPLQEIKRKLRKDFNSKVKVSTLKQN